LSQLQEGSSKVLSTACKIFGIRVRSRL
jgi:hypothetical protein